MENVYVDFDYYTDTYGGTKITSEEVFDKLAYTESRNLDIPTFYRLQEEELSDEDEEKVKHCLCELIDLQYDFDEENNNIQKTGIKSESVEGFSITYLSSEEINKMEKDQEAKKNKIIKGRLGTTGLLYRG